MNNRESRDKEEEVSYLNGDQRPIEWGEGEKGCVKGQMDPLNDREGWNYLECCVLCVVWTNLA